MSISINPKYYKVTNPELGLQAPQFARHILITESSMLVHASGISCFRSLEVAEIGEICRVHILLARNLFILLSSHLMLWLLRPSFVNLAIHSRISLQHRYSLASSNKASLQYPHVHLKSIHNIKQNTLINNATNALPLDALLSLLTMS